MRSMVFRAGSARGLLASWVAAAAAAAAAAAGPLAPRMVAAAPVPERVVIAGRGRAHGVGMCMGGAKGRAAAGQSFTQIIPHYYRGTTIGSSSEVPSKVKVSLGSPGSFTVVGDYGSRTFTIKSTSGQWLASVKAGQRAIVFRDGSLYKATVKSGDTVVKRVSSSSPLRMIPGRGTILRVEEVLGPSYNHFRGNIIAARGSGGLHVINEIATEHYLQGIAEEPETHPTEMLNTTAVLARTYAAYRVRHPKYAGQPFHLLATADSQVYRGYDYERKAPRLRAAVKRTRGQVVLYAGSVILAAYHGACGGHTEDNELVWGGSPIPYLRGVWCNEKERSKPYCEGYRGYAWTRTVSLSTIARRLGVPGRIVGFSGWVRGLDRSSTGSPRVIAFRVHYSSGGRREAMSLSGERFANVFGLSTNYFGLDNVPGSELPRFSGPDPHYQAPAPHAAPGPAPTAAPQPAAPAPLKISRLSAPAFSPDGDGLADVTQISFELSKDADVIVQVRRRGVTGARKAVLWETSLAASPGVVPVIYDGRIEGSGGAGGRGGVVAPGLYTVRVWARDAEGRIVVAEKALRVRRATVSLTVKRDAFSPVATGQASTLRIGYRVDGPATVSLTVKDAWGIVRKTLIPPGTQQASGWYHKRWSGRGDDRSLLPDGEYRLVLSGKAPGLPTSVVDRLVRIDTTAPAPHLTGPDPARFSRTLAESTGLGTALVFTPAETGTATVRIRRLDGAAPGAVVRTLSEGVIGGAPAAIVWDGRDDEGRFMGNPVVADLYLVEVSIIDQAGNRSAAPDGSRASDASQWMQVAVTP